MSCLQMLKVWDHEDHGAYIRDSQRFTSTGLSKYWLSIDCTIRFWNVVLAAKNQTKSQPPAYTSRNFSKFHWRRLETNPTKKNWQKPKNWGRRKLPSLNYS